MLQEDHTGTCTVVSIGSRAERNRAGVRQALKKRAHDPDDEEKSPSLPPALRITASATDSAAAASYEFDAHAPVTGRPPPTTVALEAMLRAARASPPAAMDIDSGQQGSVDSKHSSSSSRSAQRASSVSTYGVVPMDTGDSGAAGRATNTATSASSAAASASTAAAAPLLQMPKLESGPCLNHPSPAAHHSAAAVLRHHFKEDGPIATIPAARGHDVTVARLSIPTVGSADAKPSTVRARSALTEQVIGAIAVPPSSLADEAKRHVDKQLQSLIKREPESFEKALDEVSGVQGRRHFTDDEMLELVKMTGYLTCRAAATRASAFLLCMGADRRGGFTFVHCRLTTSDLRQLRSFFIAKGSRLLSHNEQRLRARKSEMVAGFESGTAIIKGQRFPYVRCTDVMAELKAHVDAFAAAGMLQQRADISGKELRVTLMGDKGGDFTKLLLSIWDVTDSLSPLNCVFLGLYKGAEDYDAIAEVFGPILRQLGSLPPIRWMPSAPVLPAAGPPSGGAGRLSSSPAFRSPASAKDGSRQSAAAPPRPPNHAARRRARVMARRSTSLRPKADPPDAAARARLTALRRPPEQKAAEVKQKATEERAERKLAEDCKTSK